MALNEQITGNITGKIKFVIDKASWSNLDKFQKKLTSVKKQMTDMNRTINVNAVVRSVERVKNVTVNADKAVTESKIRSSKVIEKHLKQQQNNMLKMQKDYIRKQEQMVKGANANAGMDSRLSWMFPTSRASYSASKSALADMLREEERLAKDYDRRRERVLSTRAKLNAARRKRKAGTVVANDLFRQRVDAFMTVKENQINNEAIRKGYAGSQQHKDNLSALKAARETNFNEFYGNIGQFRANINGVVNGMHTVQRTAAANKITFASLRGELVQLTAAYGAFAVAQNVANTGMKLEGIRAAAKVFTGNEAGTKEHMAYLVAMSERLGINFMTAAQEFNKFSIAVGSKASKGTQRHIFEALSEYSTVLQVDQQQYERAIRSVVQIECCLPIQ